MLFTDTKPQTGDSDNNLLGKILQEIRGNGDGVVGPQGPAGPAGADGVPNAQTVSILRPDGVTVGATISYAGADGGGLFNIFDVISGESILSYFQGTGWVGFVKPAVFAQTLHAATPVDIGVSTDRFAALYAQTGNFSTGLTLDGVNVATVEAHSTLTYAATTDIDLAGDAFRTLTLTGAVTFTTSNRAAPRSVTLKITGGGSDRALTFPSWVFVGAAAPTSLAANKTAVLTITAFGTADTDIVAAWVAQP